MKPVNLEILKFVESHPGMSINKIGRALCDRWNSSYIRHSTTELIEQGYLKNVPDGSGRCKFSLYITDVGQAVMTE